MKLFYVIFTTQLYLYLGKDLKTAMDISFLRAQAMIARRKGRLRGEGIELFDDWLIRAGALA